MYKIAADFGGVMKKRQRTVNEIAAHYGVHPNQVTQRKKTGD